MEPFLIYVLVIVFIALIFDFINGFHDAANAIATVVATKVLSPFVAVVFAAVLNFAAAFWGNHAVSGTIAKGIVNTDRVNKLLELNGFTSNSDMFFTTIVLCALIGAIVWNLITWWLGLPSSSSHALIGGFVGSAMVACGHLLHTVHGVINWIEIAKICVFIVVAPMLGMILGYALMIIVMWLFKKQTPKKVDWLFRYLQLLSSGAYSFAHGSNDAQKTMGIILFLLFSVNLPGVDKASLAPGGLLYDIILFACFGCIALGTMSGGWKIVKTMGISITKLKPVGGFCAELSGAISVLFASSQGVPVSTTHVITGSIVGVGAVHRLSAVRWGVATRIVWAWVITIPAAAIIGALSFFIAERFTF